MISTADDPRGFDFEEVFDYLHRRASRTRWGSWQYHSDNFTLECRDEHGYLYEIDLERCRTSAEVLDWIFQISKKTWAIPAIRSDLLLALDDLLDPQANLCSFGTDNPINPREVLLLRESLAGARR